MVNNCSIIDEMLQVAAKEILKKCEQAVGDHRVYIEKYGACTSWLLDIQQKFATCSGADEDLAAIERKIKVVSFSAPELVNLR